MHIREFFCPLFQALTSYSFFRRFFRGFGSVFFEDIAAKSGVFSRGICFLKLFFAFLRFNCVVLHIFAVLFYLCVLSRFCFCVFASFLKSCRFSLKALFFVEYCIIIAAAFLSGYLCALCSRFFVKFTCNLYELKICKPEKSMINSSKATIFLRHFATFS